MKKTLLILVTFLTTLLSYATDTWPGVCENISITYKMSPTLDDLRFKMQVFVENIGTTDIEQICDISEVFMTTGVTIDDDTYSPSCYPVLAAGDTKELTFDVLRDNVSIPKYDLKFKVKNPDGDKYCSEVTDHWFDAPLNINEIDRSEMEFEVSYYDLMGREVSTPTVEGFYIIEKLYTDKFKNVEKVYISQGL